MESIGLMPSATGQPGGARTGQSMTHYLMNSPTLFVENLLKDLKNWDITENCISSTLDLEIIYKNRKDYNRMGIQIMKK